MIRYNREWWAEPEHQLFIMNSVHKKVIIAFINGADIISRPYHGAHFDGGWYGPDVAPMFSSLFEYQVIDNDY